MTKKASPGFPHWKDEVATLSFRQAVVAEFIATFLFLFSTIGCVVFTQDGGITTARQLQVSLVFGIAITVLVFIMAGISGGNINPAVTWGLLLARKISPVRAACYTVAQVLGAIAGAGLVRIMTPEMFDKVDGGANEINANATAREALGVEVGCTALLVLTVMAAVDSARADAQKHIPTIAPICIGLAVTAGHFIAIPVDNCSINPARTFGVAAISGNWSDHIIFWAGPYIGATIASLIYTYLFAHHDEAPAATAHVQLDDSKAAASAAAPKAYSISRAEAVEAGANGGSDLQEWR